MFERINNSFRRRSCRFFFFIRIFYETHFFPLPAGECVASYICLALVLPGKSPGIKNSLGFPRVHGVSGTKGRANRRRFNINYMTTTRGVGNAWREESMIVRVSTGAELFFAAFFAHPGRCTRTQNKRQRRTIDRQTDRQTGRQTDGPAYKSRLRARLVLIMYDDVLNKPEAPRPVRVRQTETTTNIANE